MPVAKKPIAPMLRPNGYEEAQPRQKPKAKELNITSGKMAIHASGPKPSAGKSAPASKKVEKPLVAPKDRKLLYPEVIARKAIGPTAITSDKAKEMLGWEDENEQSQFSAEYPFHFRDSRGKKVRLNNNITNRPLNVVSYETLKQEILRRKWKLNGESVIIGQTGLVLNGQHTLIGLVLACQYQEDHPGQAKALGWNEPPTIDKTVILGISEDDDTVNTIDTAKPRSLADVLYRSEYFKTLPAVSRKKVAKIAAYCLEQLWKRTGAGKTDYVKRQTHSERLDFLVRHPKILDCVRFMFELNGEKNKLIQNRIGLGAASALLYLMGSSDTDSYTGQDGSSEAQIDWAQWERATLYWKLVAGNDPSLHAIRGAISQAMDVYGATPMVVMSIHVLAWNLWKANKKVTADGIELDYDESEEGGAKLKALPIVGGIDIGVI